MAAVMIKEIPDEVYKQFKAICKEKGLTVKGALINMMRAEIKKGVQ